MIRRIYAYHMAGWWSFSPTEWLDFLDAAIANDGEFELPPKKQLRNRPNDVRVGMRGEHGDFYSISSDVRVVHTTDWTLEDEVSERNKFAGVRHKHIPEQDLLQYRLRAKLPLVVELLDEIQILRDKIKDCAIDARENGRCSYCHEAFGTHSISCKYYLP